jgi:hypothetical protein
MHSKFINYFKKFTLILFALSIQQCCTNKETVLEKQDTMQMNHLNKISHGTAELSFKFYEIKEINGSYKILGVVEKVHGYGSTMRPLAEGNNYEFDFDNTMLDKVKEKIGNSVKIRISSPPQIMGSSELKNYKILSIEN